MSVTNTTGEYLRLHAEIESEGAVVSPAPLPAEAPGGAMQAAVAAPPSPQPGEAAPSILPLGAEGAPLDFDAAVDEVIRKTVIAPYMTVEAIAQLCAWFSTPGREVYARIECVSGKPVAYLVRGTQEDFLPAFLRKQALDVPGWRRQELAEKYAPREESRSERQHCADIYSCPERLFR